MAIQTINVSDVVRTTGLSKINANFSDLDSRKANLTTNTFTDNQTISASTDKYFTINRGGIISRLGYNYLGTFSNDVFRIFSNSIERMRFHTNGNVSFGTTTDLGERLSVNGNILVKGSGAKSIEVKSTDGGACFIDMSTTDVDREARIRLYTGNILKIEDTSKFVISSGDFGIGTTNPGSKLHISDIGDCELRISADSDNSGANEKAILRFDVDGGWDQWTIQMENLEGPASVLDFIDDSGAKRMILKRNTINMGTLPTSSAGLSSGDIWNNADVLNIV